MQYVKHHKRIAALLVLFVCALFSLALTNYTDGVASYGIPLPAGDYITSGKYLFVNNTSTTSQDSYPAYGTTFEKPLRTIDYAIGKCTANKGDIIFVAPGHAENISAANAITLDVAGVRLVGLGNGKNRPKLTWTGQNGTILVSASNCSLENFVLDFASGATRSKTGISVWNVSDFTFFNNEVIMSSNNWSGSVTATGRAGIPLYLTGATRTLVSHSRFLSGITTTASTAGLIASGVSNVMLLDRWNWDTEIGNVYAHAYNCVTGTGTIGVASSSRVSGVFIHDSTFKQDNTSASNWAMPGSGLASNVLIQNVGTFFGGVIGGTTSYKFWQVLQGKPYADGQ